MPVDRCYAQYNSHLLFHYLSVLCPRVGLFTADVLYYSWPVDGGNADGTDEREIVRSGKIEQCVAVR